jgi:cation diffusion facilitator family transporter
VLASLGLTVAKAVVGVLTGSLGLLAEAAHSGLDFVATVITWVSVRASSVKPDEEHPYGHGKLENLSALIQSALLLITCGWIISESIGRLLFRHRDVEVTVWSFAVLVVSIIVDVWRSRALRRAAARYDSQALEADALHFSTDIWSSGAVLLGLVVVCVARAFGFGSEFSRADSVAALCVVVAMLYVSLRMAKQAADFLVDRAPTGLMGRVEELVRRVPGVIDVQNLRVRQSGSQVFIDTAIIADAQASLQEADALASEVEHAVTEELPSADIIIHVEPVETASQWAGDLIRELASEMQLSVHGVRIRDIGGKRHVSVHVELPGATALADVHSRLTELEKQITARLPDVAEVETHPEPAGSR